MDSGILKGLILSVANNWLSPEQIDLLFKKNVYMYIFFIANGLQNLHDHFGPKGEFTYDVRWFRGIFDLPSYLP